MFYRVIVLSVEKLIVVSVSVTIGFFGIKGDMPFFEIERLLRTLIMDSSFVEKLELLIQ